MAVSRRHANRLVPGEFLNSFYYAPAIASQEQKVCRFECQS
jgi:hypothetical protein